MSKVAPITQRVSSPPGKNRRAANPLVDVWNKAHRLTLDGKSRALKPVELLDWAERFSGVEMDVLVIPKRTLSRRRSRGESLTVEETDKALRLARISVEADRVFGSPEKSASWLRKPNSALSGQTPLDLLRTEAGALAVEDLMSQIDHGMFV